MVVTRIARRRAADIWLRRPERALALLSDRRAEAPASSLSLLAWLLLAYARDEKEAEEAARRALQRSGDTRFASAVLAEVLMRRGEYDEALEVLVEARRRRADVPWYQLSLADALIEAERPGAAEAVLEACLDDQRLRRHALKRLSRLALHRGDAVRARQFLEGLLALAPDYLVYASDYVDLGALQLQAGEESEARATWRRGATVYPRHEALRILLAEHFGENGTRQPRVAPVREEALGVRRICVRTPIITWRTGLVDVVEECTRELRRPGDVIAVSESAAAAGQGRILPLELVTPGPLATRLCRFVGALGPLHSPQGMQGAIMQCGTLRVLVAAIAGGLGKLVGRRGWFYRVAGPPAAMIDDVAACLPPLDHHLIFGPERPDQLSCAMASALRCDVAIVDANHRSGAWVVGASPGVDRQWLSAALADNPAGNEDEQTPVVIVRRI